MSYSIGMLFSGSAVVLAILILTKYRESVGMKLALFACAAGSSAVRIIRNLSEGAPAGLFDIIALILFGFGTILEAVTLIRGRSRPASF